MELPFEATLPGTPLSVRAVRRDMSEIAVDCGMDASGVADVRLAVTEAASNAVMHAYAQTDGELSVSADVGARSTLAGSVAQPAQAASRTTRATRRAAGIATRLRRTAGRVAPPPGFHGINWPPLTSITWPVI